MKTFSDFAAITAPLDSDQLIGYRTAAAGGERRISLAALKAYVGGTTAVTAADISDASESGRAVLTGTPEEGLTALGAEVSGTAAAALSAHNADAAAHGWPRSLGAIHKKLYEIASGTASQIRILSIGDSVSYQKPTSLYWMLAGAYGVAGQSQMAYPNVAGGAVANYNFTGGDLSIYPNGDHVVVPTGGSVIYTASNNHPRGFFATRIECYYLAGPGLGHIKLQTSANNAAFADEAGYTDIDCSAAALEVRRITLTKAAGVYRVQWVNVSGSCKVFYPLWHDTSIAGLEFQQIAAGGRTLVEMLASESAGAWTQFLTGAAPDFVFIENKETEALMAAQLPTLTGLIRTVCPTAVIVLVGSNPVATSDADQVAQNAIVKAHAASIGAVYWDAYAVAGGSYAEFLARGFDSGDGVHPSALFHSLNAQLIARDFCLLAPVPVVGNIKTGKIVGLPSGIFSTLGSPRFAIDENGLRFWAYTSLGSGIYREHRVSADATTVRFEVGTNDTTPTGTTTYVAVQVASFGSTHGRLLMSGAASSGHDGGIQWVSKTGSFAGLGWGGNGTSREGMYREAANTLTVENMDLKTLTAGRGLILTAPGGTRHKVTVSDAGALVVTAL